MPAAGSMPAVDTRAADRPPRRYHRRNSLAGRTAGKVHLPSSLFDRRPARALWALSARPCGKRRCIVVSWLSLLCVTGVALALGRTSVLRSDTRMGVVGNARKGEHRILQRSEASLFASARKVITLAFFS